MSRALPTERLTKVVSEATEALATAANIRRTLTQVLRDWGTMPQEAIIAELREVLDANPPASSLATTEAFAYLKLNGRRLLHARNLKRKRSGNEADTFVPEEHLPSEEKTSEHLPFTPAFTLDDIEAKLKGLFTE